jgi:hypothetical protein
MMLDIVVLWIVVFLIWPGIASFTHITIPPPPEEFTTPDQIVAYTKLLQPILLVFQVFQQVGF